MAETTPPFVVECTEPGVAGLLHVYSESQLRLAEENP